MKKIIAIVALGFTGLLVSCNKNSESSPKDKAIDMITANAWETESVQHDTDGNLTFQYENFTIAFTKKTSSNYSGEYVVANGGTAFPDAFGQWKILDDLKTIQFDNGQEFEVDLSNGKLKLDFYIVNSGGGRIGWGRMSGLSGHFIFVLKPVS